MTVSNDTLSPETLNYLVAVRRRALVSRKLTWLAALPLGLVWALPFGRVDLSPIYLNYHDLAIGFFFVFAYSLRVHGKGSKFFSFFMYIFIFSLCMGFIVTLIRWGGNLKLYLYAVEYIAYALFAKRVYDLNKAGLIRMERLAEFVSYFIFISAMTGVVQYLILFFMPGTAESLTLKFYQFFNMPTEYAEILEKFGEGKLVRIRGAWMIPTTYSGMLLAGLPIVALSDLRAVRKIFFISIVIITILLTGSRHAWVGLILLLIIFLLSGKANIARWMVNIGIILATLSLIWIFSSVITTKSDIGSDVSDFEDIVTSRFERTMEQKAEDSSIQIRFVYGPRRFFNALREDYSIFFFGVGVSARHVAYERIGSDTAEFFRTTGFVSNSFLLVLRAVGILGFIAVLALHIFPITNRRRSFYSIVIGVAMFLLWNSGNYVFLVSRSFLVMMALLSFSYMTLKPPQGYSPPSIQRENFYD